VVFRSLTIVPVLCMLTVPALAQTPVESPVSPDVQSKVSNFESVLASAVTQAATKVSNRARQAVSQIELKLEANPQAKGYVLPTDGSMFFTVEVPGIETTLSLLWSRYRELQQPQVGVVNAATTVVDPMPLMTNPEKEYSDYTRQSIVEAMLDAITLPLKEGQTLTVSVGSTPDPRNPLASSRRLYLTIKAEDLSALRANTITRDEAKARIIEKRY